MSDSFSSVETNRKTVPFFSGEGEGRHRALEGGMFVEDISLGIMPIGSEVRRRGFDIKISGVKADQDRAIALISSLARYGRQSAKETLCDAVEAIAAQLARRGRGLYEITHIPEGKTLHAIPSRVHPLFYGHFKEARKWA